MQMLWTLQQVVGNNAAYEVISGYRSPKTNAALNAKSRGVAKRSLHLQGRAIDVRLSGTKTSDLKKAAIGHAMHTRVTHAHLRAPTLAWGADFGLGATDVGVTAHYRVT
jgi:hypothetical protein